LIEKIAEEIRNELTCGSLTFYWLCVGSLRRKMTHIFYLYHCQCVSEWQLQNDTRSV